MSPKTGFRWERPPEEVFGELGEYFHLAVQDIALVVAKKFAPEIESWMMQNAPWRDRSGIARKSLYTEVNQVSRSAVELILSHGVDYGVFLELSHAGKWGIIDRALDVWAPILWKAIQDLIRWIGDPGSPMPASFSWSDFKRK